ncbi:MAG: tetratricopeptide repeat protein [Anaeromyxobacter sp.]
MIPRLPKPLLAAAALAALAACATARPPAAAPCATGPCPDATAPAATPPGAPPPAVAFAPEEVKVTPLDLELAGKNDEELFAIGTAAYGAGDHARAAAAFARLADLFPGSAREATALFNAGLAYQRLGEWRLALERFRALERRYEGPDALEATFKAAECLYHLEQLEDARAVLDGIAARPGLAPAERIRALAQRGVVELELGQPETAEKTLRGALAAWTAVGTRDQLDPYYAAQAQYYLGETYRSWFLALRVDPSAGDEARLQADLEHKSEMLLSAQGHYLRAIRMGDDRWAVASGFRIGELYDALRAELLDAPLPPNLAGPEEQEAYRAQLRERVRVLATKAISAYEATLGRATRSGVEDLRFLADAQASLDRLRQALRDEAGAGI